MAWHDTGHVAPLSDTRPVSAVMTARLFAAPPGDAFAADVAGQAAREVLALLMVNVLPADIRRVNEIPVTGAGVVGDYWRPV
jgi:ABC-type transporter Mla maintaining outer membrane lipid asymmetry permease subunit MlaE